MHAFSLTNQTTGEVVRRISRTTARAHWAAGIPITCTDGPYNTWTNTPHPRDTAESTGDSFDDYANAAGYYATGRVWYWETVTPKPEPASTVETMPDGSVVVRAGVCRYEDGEALAHDIWDGGSRCASCGQDVPGVHNGWSDGCTLDDADRPAGDGRDDYAVCPVCETP